VDSESEAERSDTELTTMKATKEKQMKGMKYDSAELEDAERYITDSAWVMQQKLDGVRLMAHRVSGGVDYNGAGGGPVTFAAAAQWFEAIHPTLMRLPVGTVLDGELMIETGDYWVFDLPVLPKMVGTGTIQRRRREVLEHLIGLLGDNKIQVVPEARTLDEKGKLLGRCYAAGAEGVVAKRHDAIYVEGRTNVVMKLKFVKTVDCVVLDRNTGGVENAELGMYRDGTLVQVGACSMLGKPDAKVGQVIEVMCLYATAGNWLYQPRMLRIREDKTSFECEFQQVLDIVTSREVILDEEVSA
jgi:ATP-dependent DNA ligase